MRKKHDVQGLVLSTVSGIHWRSWSIPTIHKLKALSSHHYVCAIPNALSCFLFSSCPSPSHTTCLLILLTTSYPFFLTFAHTSSAQVLRNLQLPSHRQVIILLQYPFCPFHFSIIMCNHMAWICNDLFTSIFHSLNHKHLESWNRLCFILLYKGLIEY